MTDSALLWCVQNNHLMGLQKMYVKITFRNVSDLMGEPQLLDPAYCAPQPRPAALSELALWVERQWLKDLVWLCRCEARAAANDREEQDQAVRRTGLRGSVRDVRTPARRRSSANPPISGGDGGGGGDSETARQREKERRRESQPVHGG